MEIVNKKIKDLKPYENNPRNNEEAVKYVANSIKEFGFKVPLVIDKDGTIIAGHTRYEACKLLGMKEIPCIIADDLTEEQIKAFRIADNKIAEKSGWDTDKLKIELEDIDFDMTDFGFGDFELSILLNDMEPEPYDDEVIEEYSEHSEDNLASKRVIITYKTEEEEEYLKQMLKVNNLKVVYTIKEIMNEGSSN